jgi:integrase
MALTESQIRKLKPKKKNWKISDSGGLSILVATNGSLLWRFGYRYGDKQSSLALGRYPDVSLEQARAKRDEARRLLGQGIDPARQPKLVAIRKRVARGVTFAEVAEEWFERNEPRWVESYSSRLKVRLHDDLVPRFGSVPIDQVEPLEVLDAIRSIEKRGAVEMARRVLQMARSVFRYAMATGRCQRDPTQGIGEALSARGRVKHRSALSAAELPEFLQKLEGPGTSLVTRLALKLVLLTMVRTNELRFATWDEFEGISGEEPLWRIPAERMKMRRPHLVPLSPQAVDLLFQLRRKSGRSAFVLPAATKEGVMSVNTMICAIYRVGYHSRATVHGFRSTASTILNEEGFNRDWIEMQLAHADDTVRGVYNAAEYLSGRREMLNWWADYLDDLAAGRRRPGRSSKPVEVGFPEPEFLRGSRAYGEGMVRRGRR